MEQTLSSENATSLEALRNNNNSTTPAASTSSTSPHLLNTPHVLGSALALPPNSSLLEQQQEQQQPPDTTAQPFHFQNFLCHDLDPSSASDLGLVGGDSGREDFVSSGGSANCGGALTAGASTAPALGHATFYQQLMAQQYHSLQHRPPHGADGQSTSTLPPSSHLAAQYHASSEYPLVILDHQQRQPVQQQPAHVNTSTSNAPSSQEDAASSHKILAWQNGVSYASSEHHHQHSQSQAQSQSQSQAQLHVQAPSSSQSRPSAAAADLATPAKLANAASAPSQTQPHQYHSYHAPPPLIANEYLDTDEQGFHSLANDEPNTKLRSHTLPTSTPILSASEATSTIAPSSIVLAEQNVLSSHSSSFQFAHPPPLQTGAPYALHFHPPPNVAATHFAFPPDVQSSQGLNHRAKTIDLNPGANAARQSASFETRSPNERTESSASSVMDLSQQLSHTAQNSQGQRPPQHTQVARATSGWESNPNFTAEPNLGTPARPRAGSSSATPMRNAHARFQSASNVRGAPTEALDGSPARFSWDPHARMSTMDSIASSQWSPVVNDMYRFVDPLQPNFDFTFALDSGSAASSPMKQSQILPTGLAPSRLSSFSSVQSALNPSHSSSGPAQLQQANLSMQNYQQGYPPTHRRKQSGSISSTTNAGGQSAYAKDGFQFAHPHQQPTQRVQQPTLLSQPSHTQQFQSGNDSESRRASTSTSTSSAPLISPQDNEVYLPNISNQLRTSLSETQSHDPLSGYLLQEPPNPYGYRDYFNDVYESSPSSVSNPLPYAGYPISSKTVSPMPVVTDLVLASSLPMMPPTHHHQHHHPTQEHAPPIELPIAQLERQTLHEETFPGRIGVEEVKRKRTTSKKGSTSAKPQVMSTANIGDKGLSSSNTLAPAQDRAYRRLSSPVLSVRPSDDADNGSISDDDDDEEEHEDEFDRGVNEWNSSSERSRRNSQGIQYGSYPNPGFTLPVRTLSSTSAGATTFGSVPVTASSSSGSTYVTAAPNNQPVHPVPLPVDTSGLVRAVPDVSEDADLGLPRRQNLRFSDDWYTPEWVRGESAKKEGFCDLCQPGKWLQLKNSAFWYHRQYTHGISSVSGNPFSNPVSFRQSPTDASTEALCHQCNEWVMYKSRKQNAAEDLAARIPTNWFKHAHKCHFYVANRSKAEKPRGKRRKVSSSPDDA